MQVKTETRTYLRHVEKRATLKSSYHRAKPKKTHRIWNKRSQRFSIVPPSEKVSTFRFIKIQVVSWKIAYESTGGNEKQWNEQISERLSIENCDDGKCKCLQWDRFPNSPILDISAASSAKVKRYDAISYFFFYFCFCVSINTEISN